MAHYWFTHWDLADFPLVFFYKSAYKISWWGLDWQMMKKIIKCYKIEINIFWNIQLKSRLIETHGAMMVKKPKFIKVPLRGYINRNFTS
jgi:hypothetical protein